jgi:hypothetical protein
MSGESARYAFERFLYTQILREVATEKLLEDCKERLSVNGDESYWRHKDGSLLYVYGYENAGRTDYAVKATSSFNCIPGCDDIIYRHLPEKTAKALRPLSPCLRGLHHYWRNQDLYHKFLAGVHYDADDKVIIEICGNTAWIMDRLDLLPDEEEPLLLEALGVKHV